MGLIKQTNNVSYKLIFVNLDPVSGEMFMEDGGNSSKKAPPPHGRRTGGWADETARAKTGKSIKFGG